MKENLKKIFSTGGLLHAYLKEFEERKEQWDMASHVAEAFSHDQIALIEAGTGIGKSLAYLVPAILWAVKEKEKVVISTHTIALQEQLMEKDIPFILEVLNLDIKPILVKGMGNYACLKKAEENEKIDPALSQWIDSTQEGSRSEITFSVSGDAWASVSADPQDCSGPKCPFYKSCFFFKARRQLNEAQILVVNHHLLLADLTSQKEQSTLPLFNRLILDEAHHLEEIALESLSKKIDMLSLLRVLREKIEAPLECSTSIYVQIHIDFPAFKKNVLEEVESAFALLLSEVPTGLFSFRVKEALPEAVEESFLQLKESLFRFAAFLKKLEKDLEPYVNLDTFALSVHATYLKISDAAEVLERFFENQNLKERVRWIERSSTNLVLKDALLSISSELKKLLFDRFSTVVLCSATLAANRKFDFMRQHLGLQAQDTRITEKIFDSPFDYFSRVILMVPQDIPYAHESQFVKEACQMILSVLQKSQGSAFVLFTSYDMLEQCYQILKDKISPLLRQGHASRTVLLEKFKAEKGSILFGTDSFWEGVDVPGDALKCIIISKLPFKMPSDPIVEARSERFKERGKDPFMDYLLPEAVIKFKQGFGRLMRRKTDKGCIVCLDKRLFTKAYGRFFLNSLPKSQVMFDKKDRLYKEMEAFYARKM